MHSEKIHNSVLVLFVLTNRVAVPVVSTEWGAMPVIKPINLVITAILAIVVAGGEPLLTPGAVQAQDMRQAYPQEILQKDAGRLETAIRKIADIGIRPSLKPNEQQVFDRIDFQFPLPKRNDYYLNFYAYLHKGRSVVVMPVLSLKIMEDLATAYAWLFYNNYSLSTVDLYFTMLQHRPRRKFRNGTYPPLLDALGIPKNALDNPQVDKLSLSFRNEAFAFILLHEMGHILFRHKGYDEITKAQARADETQSDRFALNVLERTGTPPLGAVLFFQAQFYSMPHKGEFKSEDAWQDYLHKRSTHPLTGDRLKDMARYISGPLADRRPNEKVIWKFIGQGLTTIIGILNDVELQRCMKLVAQNSPIEILLPRRQVASLQMNENCIGRR